MKNDSFDHENNRRFDEEFDMERVDELLREFGYLDEKQDSEKRSRPAPAPEEDLDATRVYGGRLVEEPLPVGNPGPAPRQSQQRRVEYRYEDDYAEPRPRRSQTAYEEPPRRERREEERLREQATGRRHRRDYEEDVRGYEEDVPARPRKKRRAWKVLLVIVIVLVLLVLGVSRLNLFQPKDRSSDMGARKVGYSTILIAGTDNGGARTDTMMLISIDAKNGDVNLISLPRDTLINADYSVPKLNGVYGNNGGGRDGMEALMDQAEHLIGYRPDGYMLVNLDGFVDLVDAMGGVRFDVPQDMYYNDPTQDLYIDLAAGEQKLDGQQAMGLVRYRSGYASADLQRMSVQRDFIQACMDQWFTAKSLWRAPALLKIAGANSTSDLSPGNMLWVALACKRCSFGDTTAEALAGGSAWWNGGSYYAVSPYDAVEQLNTYCNPYQRDITVDDLYVRVP